VSKLSIKDFHRFMRGPFVVSIKRAFRRAETTAYGEDRSLLG
jgi:hypothetical protein